MICTKIKKKFGLIYHLCKFGKDLLFSNGTMACAGLTFQSYLCVCIEKDEEQQIQNHLVSQRKTIAFCYESKVLLQKESYYQKIVIFIENALIFRNKMKHFAKLCLFQEMAVWHGDHQDIHLVLRIINFDDGIRGCRLKI